MVKTAQDKATAIITHYNNLIELNDGSSIHLNVHDFVGIDELMDSVWKKDWLYVKDLDQEVQIAEFKDITLFGERRSKK